VNQPRPSAAERAVERGLERLARAEERQKLRPHVAEWFGHRVFPTVADNAAAQADQTTQRCPFLSRVAERTTPCIKSDNSKGVCTISAGSNGPRQDWLVCPHRALDDVLLHAMVRRLFDIPADTDIHVIPVTNLADEAVRSRLIADAFDPAAPRQFLTFQQYFGGEVSLPRSPASPELSFDATVVEVLPDPGMPAMAVRLDRYGVIEMQTTDTHGSYRHAVDALRGALDLHGSDFAQQIAAHPDWPGRKVEGPNISNVFKRTFYQVMFKFQITKRSSSAGCILALPRPVWDSWLPFLGAPQIVDMGDGTHQLAAPGETVDKSSVPVPSWIYVFDIAEQPPADGRPTPVDIEFVIATDSPTLSRLALDIAPTNAIGDGLDDDTVLRALHRRIGQYMSIG
jgi:Restriction endonuclease NotI